MLSTPNLEKFKASDFAKEIRIFMKENDISVRELATLVGTSPSNLHRLEKGKGDTTVELLIKYQKAMRTYKPRKSGASRPAKRPGRTS